MKRKNKNELLLYGILLLSIVLLAWSIYGIIKPQYYGSDYQRALQSELQDKCATPSGYTDEEWREHMSHHPDRYKECL